MSVKTYAMVYRCYPEWNDCSWFTTNYSEIDQHEELSGHLVMGQMEAVDEAK